MPPGLNRREKTDKEENPNPPETPENPGTEDSDDASVNKAQKGTNIYTYDELNRMVTSNIAKVSSTYTYDTLGNLVYEVEKNVKTDYQYNELNQLVSRTQKNQSYTYSYDKRGNRIAETGKKETREYVYDEINHLVEGTNWKGDASSYTYNGVDVRINNTQTSHSGSVYSRDYVIDYTSLERDDLMVYAEGDGQLDYVQREVYAGSERIEQFTDRSNGGYERLLYVHEDLQGNTRYYTKENGNSFAELTYDAWGMPESPNKLLNNDHGNYVYATYTGHIFDTTLDIYFCEARFYDANTRTWLAMDPIKDGGNWYQYCYSNPLKYWDPLGLAAYDPGQPWANRNQPYSPTSSSETFTTYGGCDSAMPWTIKTRDQTIELQVYQISMERLRNNPVYQSIVKVLGGIGKAAAGVTLVIGIVGGSATVAPVIGGIFVVSGSGSAIFGANEIVSGLIDIKQMLNGKEVENNNFLLNHVFGGDQQEYQAWSLLFDTITASGHLTIAYQNMFPDTTKGGSGVKYSPVNPGPLSEDVANSFNGATYTERVLTEDTVMYRVSGGNAKEVGSYMSMTPQGGGLQSQLDLALNPAWGNTTQNVTKVVVPKGTTIYEGIAAPQNIYDSLGNVIGTLPGGGNQVYIPTVEAGWFQ